MLIAPALPDRIDPIGPSDVTLDGYLGARVAANDAHLAEVDLDPLLAGFQSRPGSHPWIGEHIGKWLHAASLTLLRTRSDGLAAKVHDALDRLIATQEGDGYLGTYPAGRRFTADPGVDWDVWVHKYVLIGMLAAVDATGDDRALAAAVRVGDLLDRTFRTDPRPTRIVDAGTHVGMAATSVLEPIVVLYRHTGEARYLELAWSIVEAWDGPGGPRVLSTLRGSGRVREIGNGKAYEMLSNLVGLCELARASGDRSLVDAVVRGWEDVVANHRYLTGGASFAEHFGLDRERPPAAAINVAETCVSVTWLQLSHQLLRLTGDPRCADEVERTVYNHLLAAQHPAGRTWCYYTPLDGAKAFGPGISCCVSSGPRGLALVPSLVYGRTADDRVTVHLFETSSAPGIRQVASLPASGGTILAIDSRWTGVAVRAPAWASHVRTAGGPIRPGIDGWVTIERPATGEVAVDIGIEPRTVDGDGTDLGRVARAFGPFVLAYPTAVPGHRGHRTPAFDVIAGPGTVVHPVDASDRRVRIEHRLSNPVDGLHAIAVEAEPFAEVGQDGASYRVWADAAPSRRPVSQFVHGVETRAAGTIEHGSAIDHEPTSFASSFDGTDHGDDWFAVTVDRPVSVGRIVVGHGWSWVNGGWFDASAGGPIVEVQVETGGAWMSLGEIPDYPATTAADPAGLRGGETFEVVLPAPRPLVGIRVRGRGSFGAYPPARYATCGELSGFPS